MARLVFVDGVGGSLAALAAAMARIDGAPGFDEAAARTTVEVRVDPIVGEVLGEVGVGLVPGVKPLSEIGEHDVVIALGDADVPKPANQWPLALAYPGSPELVARATARTVRDRLARNIAVFCRRG